MSNESVRVKCPVCGKIYRAKQEAAGKSFPCTGCGAQVTVPSELAAPSGLQAPQPLQPYGGRQETEEPPPPPPQEPAPQEPAAQPTAAPQGSLPAQMRANLQIAGKHCPCCAKPIELGEPVRNCEQCSTSHHEECWQSHGGCGKPDCANAPLPKMRLRPDQPPPVPVAATAGGPPPAPGAAPAVPGDDMKRCPYCGESIAKSATKCRFCKEYLPGAGPKTSGATRHCDKATHALICGILSFVCCGIVLGPIAIWMGLQAKNEIAASEGRLTGGGVATAGMVLGIIGTVITGLAVLVQILAATAGSM